MIKVVAFDLVGVLVKEKDVELSPIEDKLERMFGDNLNDLDYLNEAKKLTNDSVQFLINNICDKLYESVDSEIFTKLKKDFEDVYFIIASNHISFVKSFISKTFDDVDDVIISAEIGMIKPNTDFYQYILDKYDIEPNELLFLDDNMKNINGAALLGINTIFVDKNTNLFNEITKVLRGD